MSDNFYIRVDSEGRDHFLAAMKLGFSRYSNNAVDEERAVGYAVHPEKGMILFWMAEETCPGYTPFPYEMAWEQAAEFAWGWLNQADYGHEPDHDGDNSKGFSVYNGGRKIILTIKPIWMMYGR